MNFVIKQCRKCMATVHVLKEDGCDIMCCGETMKELVPNSVDAAFEKHVPTYEVKDNKIYVVVNHVMEEDHYIEWIAMHHDGGDSFVHLKPGEEAKAVFDYVPGATLYSYCNKHSLWKCDVQ